MNEEVVLRAASGPAIGAGHVRRARAVAQALQAGGARARLIVDDEASAARRARSPPRDPRPGGPPRWAGSAGAYWLDGRRDWTPELTELAGARTLLVEPVAARERAAAVLQPALHWVPDAWEQAHRERVLGGAPWIPLAREVTLQAPLARVERDVDLLVTFGASDPRHLTEEVLQTLAGAEQRVIVTAGEHMGARRAALERLTEALPNAQLLSAVRDLSPWMRRSRAAVTAVGTTLYELAYLRVPAWILAHREDDRAALDWYGRHGPHAPLGLAGELSEGALAALLEGPPRVQAWPAGLGAGAARIAAWLCGRG